MIDVGIDALGVALPPYSLALTSLAAARGVDPGKYVDGLGTVRMSIAPVDEDTVTLAARAARAALAQAGAARGEVGMLAVGTETGVDHSKPVSSYVQGLLGLPTDCRVFETKHACYGGTAALQNALDWVRAGSARGKKALVVCSDIARYGLRTPGEPTQGAGAVALLIGERPRLLSFAGGVVGTYANDVFDFWRPLYAKDAVVDGHYSVECYLRALEGAYRAYQERAPRSHDAGPYADRFAAIAYHVPYGKMSSKAHRHLRALDGDQEGAASYERQVAAGLVLPKSVGNIYTGSLYLSLASLLAETRADISGSEVALFSYGSGSCAEFFAGTVVEGAQARARAAGWGALIEGQRRLEIDDYERIMNDRESIDTRPFDPELVTTPGGGRYLGVKDHRRVYSPFEDAGELRGA